MLLAAGCSGYSNEVDVHVRVFVVWMHSWRALSMYSSASARAPRGQSTLRPRKRDEQEISTILVFIKEQSQLQSEDEEENVRAPLGILDNS